MSEVSDDKHQHCNHCYKTKEAGQVVRFHRKHDVKGQDSTSLGMNIPWQMRYRFITFAVTVTKSLIIFVVIVIKVNTVM